MLSLISNQVYKCLQNGSQIVLALREFASFKIHKLTNIYLSQTVFSSSMTSATQFHRKEGKSGLNSTRNAWKSIQQRLCALPHACTTLRSTITTWLSSTNTSRTPESKSPHFLCVWEGRFCCPTAWCLRTKQHPTNKSQPTGLGALSAPSVEPNHRCHASPWANTLNFTAHN